MALYLGVIFYQGGVLFFSRGKNLQYLKIVFIFSLLDANIYVSLSVWGKIEALFITAAEKKEVET